MRCGLLREGPASNHRGGAAVERAPQEFQGRARFSLEKEKKNDESTVPVISNTLLVVHWFEAYGTWASDYISQSGCTLLWVARENQNAPPLEPLEVNQPFSAIHGSVDEETKMRLAHTGANFRADNTTLFNHLVTATIGTIYASTLAPFRRAKNGRAALAALKALFAGAAHWDAEVKKMQGFLMNRTFTGQGQQGLGSFMAQHRASFHTL